jgi:hypothetical protein
MVPDIGSRIGAKIATARGAEQPWKSYVSLAELEEALTLRREVPRSYAGRPSGTRL